MPHFLRRSLELLAVLPAVVAVVLPQAREWQSGDGIKTLTHTDPWLIEYDHQNAKASFGLPCNGQCAHEDSDQDQDDFIVVPFQAFPSITHEGCGSTNVTINGEDINAVTTWKSDYIGNHGEGRGSLSLISHSGNEESEVSAVGSWSSFCLRGVSELDDRWRPAYDEAQMFGLVIEEVNGHTLDYPMSFSISFRQSPTPSLLRLGPIPSRVPNHMGDFPFWDSQEWRDPPAALRMSTVCKKQPDPAQSFERELYQLRALEHQAMDIEAQIHAKKELLQSYIDRDAKTLKEELADCHSFVCYAKTLLSKAHSAARVIYHKVAGSHHNHQRHRRDERFAAHAANHQTFVTLGVPSVPASSESSSTTRCAGADFPPFAPKPRPEKELHSYFLDSHSEFSSINPLTFSLKVVISVTVLIFIYVLLHRTCGPRQRAERLARREERRNRRAFRRAARYQAWKDWWSGIRANRRRAPLAYEEKCSIVLEQESVLENAMQAEIRALRDAHSTVNSLITSPPQSPSPYATRQRRSRQPPADIETGLPLARTDSLPDYRSDSETTSPPAYESEDDTSVFVSNGFSRYTPSSPTSSTASMEGRRAESSIIEVSPRPSAETTRTTMTSRTT